MELLAKRCFYTVFKVRFALEKKRHPRMVAMQGTCSCLGIECPRFPSDENIISKLAVAVYTNRGGPVEDRGLRIFEEVLQLQDTTSIYYKIRWGP